MPRKAKAASAPPVAEPAPAKSGPSYWLFKTEPSTHSWEMQKARGKKGEPWDGVRNFTARNNLRTMKEGDWAFFYHSNIGKEVVGVAKVLREAYPDLPEKPDPHTVFLKLRELRNSW